VFNLVDNLIELLQSGIDHTFGRKVIPIEDISCEKCEFVIIPVGREMIMSRWYVR